jgi:hypothetical protein
MGVKGGGLLVLAAVLTAGSGQLARTYAQTPGTACGLGPPPGSPGYAEAVARHEAEVRQRGYELVCDANLARYDIPWKMRPLSETPCPNEPPAKPMRIGPGGMPINDPPPAVLTQADVDAMNKPRPCK